MKRKIFGRKVGAEAPMILLISSGEDSVDVLQELELKFTRRAVRNLRAKGIEGFVLFGDDQTHYKFTPDTDFVYVVRPFQLSNESSKTAVGVGAPLPFATPSIFSGFVDGQKMKARINRILTEPGSVVSNSKFEARMTKKWPRQPSTSFPKGVPARGTEATALSVLAEGFGLTSVERHFVLAMLRASPVALQGEETLVPLIDLVAVMGHDKNTFDDAKRIVDSLAKPKGIETAGGAYYSFPWLSSFGWNVDSTFFRFKLEKALCVGLQQVAKERGIAAY